MVWRTAPFCLITCKSGNAAFWPLTPPRGEILRRIVYTADFLNAAVIKRAFHQFISEQRDDAATQKQRLRVPVPIDARRPAGVVFRALWMRSELSCFFEVGSLIVQKENRCGAVEEMLRARAAGKTDGKA